MGEHDFNADNSLNEVTILECRTCLHIMSPNDVLFNILQKWNPPWDGMENTIAEDLEQLTNVKVKQSDKHSKVICRNCYELLHSACAFTTVVKQSEQILRQRYPLEQEMDNVWPKPIQIDNCIQKNSMNVDIKQEALSDDEYDDAGSIYENSDVYAKLDIKVEPEQMIQQQPSELFTVNAKMSASEMSSDCEIGNTPPDITERANIVANNLLPEKSRHLYEKCYEDFVNWQETSNVPKTSLSENVLLVYFEECAKKFQPSTLWTRYSMLRSVLNIKHKIELSTYTKLIAFLKRKSQGFKGKKAKSFTTHEIKKFLDQAPSNYLLMKVALIIGIMGACRRNELYQLKFKELKDIESAIVITIPTTKTKTARTFTITGKFAEFCREYMMLRPKNCNSPYFFLNYVNGKCTTQRVGINKLGSLGKTIASYLKLPNPELYTGHCFRRSSATLLVDAGGDLTDKRHGGWKS